MKRVSERKVFCVLSNRLLAVTRADICLYFYYHENIQNYRNCRIKCILKCILSYLSTKLKWQRDYGRALPSSQNSANHSSQSINRHSRLLLCVMHLQGDVSFIHKHTYLKKFLIIVRTHYG